ncbi:SGNH/GDSL hydrolase family protein [Propionibacteriaceae bacterium Y2011]|uniref:SGNH/GDSL hydrolase family protein n=1 Tax=Microlunatus sp. Y2014 TaxID=3418488 RepID=UPI003B447B06
MSRILSRTLRTVLTGVVAAAAALGSVTVAHAQGPGYVALGDSYSSGTGTRTYYDDGTDCQRSPKSYAALLASRYALDLTLAACSGATTADVTNQQLSSLRSTTRHVTITVGGNDVGFAPVLTECAKPGWWGDCEGAIEDALAVVNQTLPGRLSSLNSKIKARSPQATVVVSGYPHIFNGDDCHVATFFSPGEQSRLNAATDRLNDVVRQRAVAAGFRYASPVAAFDNHAWCDDNEWINGLSWPISESYHPNVAGHVGYSNVFGPRMGVSSTLLTKQARTTSLATTPSLPPATGRSESVTAPDLSSAEAARAASRAGITDDELAQLRAAQRRGAGNAELESLSARTHAKAQARNRTAR